MNDTINSTSTDDDRLIMDELLAQVNNYEGRRWLKRYFGKHENLEDALDHFGQVDKLNSNLLKRMTQALINIADALSPISLRCMSASSDHEMNISLDSHSRLPPILVG